MQKAKKYDWKDSNLALFGSDTEKSVRTSFLYHRYSFVLVSARCLFALRFCHLPGEEGVCRDRACLAWRGPEGRHAGLEDRQVQG